MPDAVGTPNTFENMALNSGCLHEREGWWHGPSTRVHERRRHGPATQTHGGAGGRRTTRLRRGGGRARIQQATRHPSSQPVCRMGARLSRQRASPAACGSVPRCSAAAACDSGVTACRSRCCPGLPVGRGPPNLEGLETTGSGAGAEACEGRVQKGGQAAGLSSPRGRGASSCSILGRLLEAPHLLRWGRGLGGLLLRRDFCLSRLLLGVGHVRRTLKDAAGAKQRSSSAHLIIWSAAMAHLRGPQHDHDAELQGCEGPLHKNAGPAGYKGRQGQGAPAPLRPAAPCTSPVPELSTQLQTAPASLHSAAGPRMPQMVGVPAYVRAPA